MTNREKWTRKVAVTDELVEDVICKTYATYGFGDSEKDCPECPIKHLCDPYMDSAHSDGPLITHEEYMAKVSEWLNKEANE